MFIIQVLCLKGRGTVILKPTDSSHMTAQNWLLGEGGMFGTGCSDSPCQAVCFYTYCLPPTFFYMRHDWSHTLTAGVSRLMNAPLRLSGVRADVVWCGKQRGAAILKVYSRESRGFITWFFEVRAQLQGSPTTSWQCSRPPGSKKVLNQRHRQGIIQPVWSHHLKYDQS